MSKLVARLAITIQYINGLCVSNVSAILYQVRNEGHKVINLVIIASEAVKIPYSYQILSCIPDFFDI